MPHVTTSRNIVADIDQYARLSRNGYDMALEDLAAIHPWLNVGHETTGLHPQASAKYVPVSTVELLATLADYGFRLSGLNALRFPNSRTEARAKFRPHLVTLINTASLPVGYKGRTMRPMIVVMNSGDRTKALSIYSGIFEFACLNGCIVGQVDAAASHKHLSGVVATIDDMIRAIDAKSSADMANMRAMIDTQIRPDQAAWLAMEAAKIRFGDEASERVRVGDLLKARRAADMGLTLYSVYQRVQENIFAPHGVRLVQKDGSSRYAPALVGHIPTVTVNTRLFEAAMSLAA